VICGGPTGQIDSACFGSRYSDFEFCFPGARRSRDENFLGDLPSMQGRILLSLAGASPQEDQASLPLLQSPVFGRGESQDRRVTIKVVENDFRF
jgi:hypothetical protein